MTSEKWRIVYLGGKSPSKLEARIVAEFDRLYQENGKPDGMALFSHTTFDGAPGISMTPTSIEYCTSLLAQYRWNEAVNEHGFGYPGWLAGDERLKF
jgi:hypothetical protein